MKQAERSGGACQPIQGDTIARTYPNTTDSAAFDGTSTGTTRQRRNPIWSYGLSSLYIADFVLSV